MKSFIARLFFTLNCQTNDFKLKRKIKKVKTVFIPSLFSLTYLLNLISLIIPCIYFLL